MRGVDPRVELLLDLLDQAFDWRSWHGTNLRGSVRGLEARQAAWRPAPARHNIWEIVVHAAYWKYVARRRLSGGKRGSFSLKGSNWFPRPASGGEREWRGDVALLEAEHRELRDTVSRLKGAELGKGRSSSGYDNAALIRGIAAHDLYHAGQIQLLKRLGAVGSRAVKARP